MSPSKQLALSLILPIPAVAILWLDALWTFTSGLIRELPFVMLAAIAAVMAVIVAVRRLGPQYSLEGSNNGVLLVAIGLFSYLFGTWIQSDLVHLASIVVFYWGCVLYLGGARELASIAPTGLAVLALYPLQTSGRETQLALGGVFAGCFAASLLLLWDSRRQTERGSCRLCPSFRDHGAAFCSACGRRLKSMTILPKHRRLAGFLVFSVILVSLLAVAVPVSFPSSGSPVSTLTLGGMVVTSPFAPLSGWSASSHVYALSGGTVQRSNLVKGKSTVQALVSVSFSSAAAEGALSQLTGNMTFSPAPAVQTSQSLQMYTAVINGTSYEGVQGSFPVVTINGSAVGQSFVAFDIQQTSSKFKADNGATLYSTGASFASWLSGSAGWFPALATLLPLYQLANQAFADVLLGLFAILLFSSVRSHDLAIVRKLESTLGLTDTALSHLRAFGSRGGTRKGEDYLAIAREVDPKVEEPTFYRELDELSRRGLLVPHVSIIKGEPTLLWRCVI